VRGRARRAGTAMPTAFALLAAAGGQPLVVAPADGVALGSATAALRQFAALALQPPGARRAGGAGEELCLPSGAVVHHRTLAGGAVVAAVLCEPGENPYEGKEALADLDMVRGPPARRPAPPCLRSTQVRGPRH